MAATKGPVASRKPHSLSTFKWVVSKQLEISFALLVIILGGNLLTRPEYYLSTHYTPAPSYHLRSKFSRFLFLSFQKPGTELYFKGRDDAYLITFWFILFCFLREATMRWLWSPLAKMAGISEKRSIVRFAEQGWSLLYYTVFFSLGLYIMQTSPYKNLDTPQFYIGYPHDALPPLTKWYYLVQTSFWWNQILVLNVEERRKDHVQMFTHHIITNLLVGASYILNWTRIGNATLVVMDFADILLPLAKLFDYTKNSVAADTTFVFFLLSWILTRHVLYGIILWSVIFELPRYVPYGWRPRDGYFSSVASHTTFYMLLVALQVMICFWFVMIVRVAYGAIMGKKPSDTRSDAAESDLGDPDDIIFEENDVAVNAELSEETQEVTAHAGLRVRNGVSSKEKENGAASVESERKKDR